MLLYYEVLWELHLKLRRFTQTFLFVSVLKYEKKQKTINYVLSLWFKQLITVSMASDFMGINMEIFHQQVWKYGGWNLSNERQGLAQCQNIYLPFFSQMDCLRCICFEWYLRRYPARLKNQLCLLESSGQIYFSFSLTLVSVGPQGNQ